MALRRENLNLQFCNLLYKTKILFLQFLILKQQFGVFLCSHFFMVQFGEETPWALIKMARIQSPMIAKMLTIQVKTVATELPG
jgi:hypothetical protein